MDMQTASRGHGFDGFGTRSADAREAATVIARESLRHTGCTAR